MLYVQKKLENYKPGDLIAFFREEKFLGYGKILEVIGDLLLVEEDNSVKREINEVSMLGYTCDIEIY